MMGTMEEGARNAVEVCMGVKPNERVLIVTDKAEYEIGDVLRKAACKITENVSLVVLEDYGERPMKALPEQINGMIPKMDVTFWAAGDSEGEFPARKTFFTVAGKYVRHAHMPGITKQVMEQGMCSDYNKIREFTNTLYETIKNARKIEVTNTSGTNLKIDLNPKWKWITETGIFHQKTKGGKLWVNLPAGVVYTAPFIVNGKIVIDELGDWFDKKYGVLSSPENKENTQVQIDIVNSRAGLKTVECKNQQLKKDLIKYLRTDKNSDRVGEIEFPTNLELLDKPLIGNLLQDEKARVHIAFGHAYIETGAKWECNTHVDCLMKACDVWADGRKIMENGKYL